MTKKNATEKDITNRLKKAKLLFFQLKKIKRSHSIRQETKIKIHNSNMLSVLLYGAECWRVTQRGSEGLLAFHTSCLQKICIIDFIGPKRSAIRSEGHCYNNQAT